MSRMHGKLHSDLDSAYARLDSYHPAVNKAFYHSVSVVFDKYVSHALDDFLVHDTQHIPDNGSFIGAPNHTSHLDHAFVGKAILDSKGRPMRFMAKEGFWTDNFGAIAGRFVERGGGFPIDRNTGLGIDGQPAVRATLDSLFTRGQGLIQYPQGKRIQYPKDGESADPTLSELKTGVAQNAIRYQVPILPIGMAGAEDRDVVAVVFGPLLQPPQVENRFDRSEIAGPARELTYELADSMEHLRELANQYRTERLACLRSN